MNDKMVNQLARITDEEKKILDGSCDIDQSLFNMSSRGNIVSSAKLLSAGKLITIRLHTRFAPFPEHRHDYVEMVYVCRGTTEHIVNKKKIRLGTGEILMMNQHATHEVMYASENDVAINFIILPEFFSACLPMIGEEETPLRKFLVACLCDKNSSPGFLHFKVSDVEAVQNLVENLVLILTGQQGNKRKMSQLTMALLFMQLLACADTLDTNDKSEEAIVKVLNYVETNYANADFAYLAKELHYAPSWLSREIKRKTGKTYTELLQGKRLAQAAFLLQNTDENITDIASAVGYENVSYFYRRFTAEYGMSPKHYRSR